MPDPDRSYDLAPAAPAAPRPARLPEMQLTDRLCPHCNYNLRGLPKGRRCPECGAKTVAARFFNDELQYGNLEWSSRLALGMLLFLAGAALLPVALLLGIFSRLHFAVPLTIGAAENFLEFLGLWLLTTPEPVTLVVLPANPWNLRRLLRYTAGATLLADAAMRLQELFHMEPSGPLSVLHRMTPAIFTLALDLRVLLMAHFLHNMAKRIPDDSLAARILAVAWGFILASPILFLMMFVGDGSSMMRGVGSLFGLACAIVPLAPVVFLYLWGMKMLSTFFIDLHNSAREARKAMITPPGTTRG